MKGLLPGCIFPGLAARCFVQGLPCKRKEPHHTAKERERTKRCKASPAAISEEAPSLELVDNNRAIVRLSANQTLVFDGCAMVCLAEGSASMHGYSLVRATEVLVSSCSTLCSALTFQASQSGCVLRFNSCSLEQPDDDSLSFSLEIVDDPGSPSDAGARKRKTISSDAVEGPQKRLRPTITPCEWSSTVDLIMSVCDRLPPVVPVCGGKGVGKSTFARFLVNRLLTRYKAVAYLDADVGQPEFTIPGCLSLHILEEPITGSPVSHLRIPQRGFFYGDITPQSDPRAYANYFKHLYDYFRRAGLQIPLVINSLGWRAGVGYDLLLDILRYSTPTHVVEILSGEEESVPPLPLPDDIAPVLRLERAFSCSTGTDRAVKTAAQLRALRVLHYFHACAGIDSSLDLRFEEVAKALVGRVPYQVSADDLEIVHLHVQVPASQQLLGLNAQLVGLATSSQTEEPVPCVGFGIIRAIDADRRILYILTPCSPDVLEGVDTILQGRLDIPAALLQVEGYMCPYLSTSQVVEGTGSSILRRRVPKRKISLS